MPTVEPAPAAQTGPLLEAQATPELWRAVQLAINTGARLGDLRKLTWAHVGQDALSWQTGKSNRKRTVVVPITEDLRALLAAIPRTDIGPILRSSRGKAWSEPGLETALRKARLAADKAAEEAGSEVRTIGRRWHDMRGTFATYRIRDGMDFADIATILGWKKEQVEELARRYVSADSIAQGIMSRWKARR